MIKGKIAIRALGLLSLVGLLLLIWLSACASLEEKRDRFMAQGKAAFEKGDFIAARLHFKNALQLDPKLAEGHLWLGKTELRLQNPRNAFGSLSKAVELDPGLMEAQLLLGNLYLAAQKPEEAEVRAKIVLDKEPQNPEALLLTAGIALSRERPEEALRILAQVRQAAPGKVEAYLLSVGVLTRQKKAEEAKALLEEGLKANPQAVPLYLTRARLAEEEKDYAKAAQVLDQARQAAPKNTQVLDELARLFVLQHQWDKAEAALREKTALEPDNEAHAAALARFLAGRGRAEEGEKLLQDFVAGHPQRLEAKFALANFYLGQRRFGKGEQVLKEIVAADPSGPQGLKAKGELAVLYLGQDRKEEADKLAQEILKDNPKDMTALKVQGLLALAKKDGLKAVANFRILTQDQPQNPENWLLLARAHQLQKEETLAREAAKKAIDLKPDYTEAKGFLYGLYLEKKDYDGLIRLIRDYLRANERDLVNWGYLGDVYMVKGDLKEAQAAFQKMVALDPKNPQGYVKLALMFRQQKQPQAAAAQLERAVQENPRAYQALRLLVALYSEQQQPGKALEVVKAQAARSPKNDEIQQILGEVLLSLKQYEAAAAALEEAVVLNPNDPQALGLWVRALAALPKEAPARRELVAKAKEEKAPAWYPIALAQLYEREGQGEQAIEVYERLLARRVAEGMVKNNLAYLLAEHRPTPEQLARARKLAEEVLADNPTDPRLLDTLGWIHCQQQDFAGAKNLLEKAVAKAPEHPVLNYHLGYCLARLGEKEAARIALARALAAKGDFPQREAAQKLKDSLSGP